jgi:hypothetical protein
MLQFQEDLNRTRPKDGELLVVHQGCGRGWQEFQLWPNGSLMFTRHGMCVKPIGFLLDGVEVGQLVLRYCYNVLTLNKNKQTWWIINTAYSISLPTNLPSIYLPACLPTYLPIPTYLPT